MLNTKELYVRGRGIWYHLSLSCAVAGEPVLAAVEAAVSCSLISVGCILRRFSFAGACTASSVPSRFVPVDGARGSGAGREDVVPTILDPGV